MNRNFNYYLRIWILALFCGLTIGSNAQELASAKNALQDDIISNQKKENQSLKEVLSDLSRRYNVNFNYDSDRLQGIIIDQEVKFSAKSFDQSLNQLLTPIGLKFKKVNPDIYIIQPQESDAKGVRLKGLTASYTENGEGMQASLVDLPNQVLRKSATPVDLKVVISGRVVSDQGQAIPGVNVVFKGTTIGTITDIDGVYSLDVPNQDGILVFSYIGYATQEVAIGGRSTINVTMQTDITSLEEVVVTALGIRREAKSLGYATSTVAPEEITVNRTPNFMNALTGKIAGVNITNLGSGPAGTSKIRIRGQSSFGGQNQPLIVLNGVPIDNTNFGATSGNQGSDAAYTDRGRSRTTDSGDGLSSINPDDIESMTVLRGAAASALYGSRAKDGVIMITTRSRGAGTGIGVEYNTNYTFDTPLDYTDYQYEFGQGENGVRPTTANPTSGVWSFGERFQPGMTQILFNGIEVPYVAQPPHVGNFYRTGHSWTNTVTLSAGGEQGGFHLSLSNLDNQAIVPNSEFERRTINLGFTQRIAQRLTVSGNVNYSNEYIKNPPQIAEQDMSTPTTLYSLANSMPLELMRENMANENNNEYLYSRFTNRTNPYWATFRKFENVRRDRIFGNLTARYDIADWLYVQGRVGQDYWARDHDYNFPTGSAPLPAAPSGFVNGQFIQDARRFRELNSDFLIGANRTYGDFGVNLTLGGNHMYRRMDRNNVFVTDFIVRDLYTVQNARQKDPIYQLSERAVNSLYGMAEFSFREYLFINGTVRNDWFSTLSPANRSILYPAITGSFVFSQAFENLPNWLSFGKIRAGYAEVGSDTDVQPYADNLFYRVEGQLFPDPQNPTLFRPVGVINTSTVPNPNLRPMRVSEWEAGIEFKLFENRIGLDLTYYNKLTTDQILAAQVSDASGYTNQLINVGESRNQGVEMLFTVVPVQTNNFRWDFSFNATYNTSEVLKLGATPADSMITVGTGQFDGDLRHVVGQPMGQLFGFGFQRDAQGRQIFDPNNGIALRTPLPIQYGTAIPIWIGGIMNSFNYRGFTLSALVDFKLGHKLISGTNFNAWRHGLHKGTLVGRDQGFVVGDGVNPNGEVNTAQASVQPFYEVVRTQRIQEPFVYNAGFWQFRQITMGYDFASLLPENMFIKGLRLSAVANNVALLKKWVDNIHPEQFGMSSDNLMGLEAPGLPITRSIGFNLNVRF
ncbi:SusC/RagA family TonB-linked outer membrane protein [soil metagenome]